MRNEVKYKKVEYPTQFFPRNRQIRNFKLVEKSMDKISVSFRSTLYRWMMPMLMLNTKHTCLL